MNKVDDIEKAAASLGPAELAKFRAWFEEFDAARFDQKIAADIEAGRLDKLAERAIADFRAGCARDL